MHRRHLLGSALALAALPACATARTRQDAVPGVEAIERAFHYAFPLYEFTRIELERTGATGGQSGRLNTIVHRAQLQDHTSLQVTAPNNDTIYSSCFLELSGGPVEVNIPTSTERYFSVAFMQAFTDVFAYVGTRATGGQGGRYWIVGPGWRGSAPEGVQVIASPTNDVWMLMRTLVDGPDDLAAARALQEQLTLTIAPDRPAPRGFEASAGDVTDPVVFLTLVNEVIARNPERAGLLARADEHLATGVGAGSLPSAEVLEQWRAFIPQGLAALRETFRFRDYAVEGWSYQPPGVGEFGDNDLLRAAVALGGIAALGEEEAMYFHANFDIDGQPLDGSQAYRWRVPPGGVPVDGFWSLTMYRVTPEGRYFFVENPINRFAIGDRTEGLVVEEDGSIEILIQRERPEGPMAANWLPAPEHQARLALRAYLPRAELRDRSWRVPPLQRIS